MDSQPNMVFLLLMGCINIVNGKVKIQLFQVIQVLNSCKLPSDGKQLPAFPLEVGPGTELRPQRWKARVLPLCHRGPTCTDKVCLQRLTPRPRKTVYLFLLFHILGEMANSKQLSACSYIIGKKHLFRYSYA